MSIIKEKATLYDYVRICEFYDDCRICPLGDVQQEEREQSKYFNLAMECARDKAIKEFAERLKNKIWHHSACNHEMLITTDDIDDLAREMTEVQK